VVKIIIRISKQEINREVLQKAGIKKNLVMLIKSGDSRTLVFNESLTAQEIKKIISLLNKWKVETLKFEDLEFDTQNLLRDQLKVLNLSIKEIEV